MNRDEIAQRLFIEIMARSTGMNYPMSSDDRETIKVAAGICFDSATIFCQVQAERTMRCEDDPS